MEGRAQVEQALEALGRKDPGAARMAIAGAVAVAGDSKERLGAIADAVYLAAAELEGEGEISAATWNHLADAVGPGRLQSLVEQYR